MLRKLYAASLIAALVALNVAAQKIRPAEDLQDHAKRGYELYDAGAYRAAKSEFEKARSLAAPSDRGQAVRLDYYIAECAGKLGRRDAMTLIDEFLMEYPGSVYANDARLAKANLLYLQGDYKNARREYSAVDRFALRTSQQDEYNFKTGHSFFMEDDLDNARTSLQQVGRSGSYAPHADYYLAYIDYVGGNYAAAKRGFARLAANPAYEKVVPFYLLQIEFLEGNYDYVTANGDPLLEASGGERQTEIARIMGESWFHKDDFGKALRYMSRYRDTGGYMGRAENYLTGYSHYMRNDVSDAIESLSQVAGPDDKLTQNAAYHLGGAYLRAGDKVRAMQSFSMASGADYDHTLREDALFNYGKLQYELGGGVFNEAVNILNRYIAEYPASPRVDRAREYLVAAYYNSRNYEAAYEAIKLIPDPDNNIRTAYQKIAYFRALEHYNKGDYDRSYQMLEESYRNRFNPKYTALTRFWMGEILYRRGDYTKAVPLFKEYIRLAPATENEYKTALYDLGYSYFNQRQWAESRQWFDKFLSAYSQKDSYRADALNRTGDARFAAREFRQALTNYDAAARLDTDEKYYARYQKAVIEGLIGNRDRKVGLLREIISEDKGAYVGAAMYELGRTYMVAERFGDAAAVLREFTERYPSDDNYLAALSRLGLACQNMDDNNAALKYYKTIVEKAPASPQARDAMLAAKGIYVDMNNVDAYFDFAARSGVETDTGAVARDSLSFAAAERIYMTSSDRTRSVSALNDYLQKFPRGAYRPNALFFVAELHIAEKRYGEAIDRLKELGNTRYNSFTVRGLEKLAPLCFAEKRYGESADAYKRLAEVSVNPETKGAAYAGYFKSVKAGGDESLIMAAADEVMAARGVSASLVREAKFAKAGILSSRGKENEATAVYRELAVESQSAEGAESTYVIINHLFREGDFDSAEKLILRLAGENTPHTYWLGKAFLTLGDIYQAKGDSFQARATLQSVVDGYLPLDDGIVAAAKEKIGRLGE